MLYTAYPINYDGDTQDRIEFVATDDGVFISLQSDSACVGGCIEISRDDWNTIVRLIKKDTRRIK